MTLALVIPVLNHKEETLACLKSFKETASGWDDLEVLIVDNGSRPPAYGWGIPEEDCSMVLYPENRGVLQAHQEGYESTKADYIYYSHNDATMFEKGWDDKILATIALAEAESGERVGVAGFFGAKGIGTPDIYRSPYQMRQLARNGCVSSCHRMDAVHGHRPVNEDYELVTVLDGFSLIVSRDLLTLTGGFDMNLPQHHQYDNNVCLDSIDCGFINIVIPMDAFHHGGVTDVSEDWATPFGKSKQEIHAEAHYPYFYFRWSPDGAEKRKDEGRLGITLPYSV